MKRVLTCEYCEEPFAYRLSKRFCSPNCRAKHKYAQKKNQPKIIQPQAQDKQLFATIIEKVCRNREILASIANNIENVSIEELLSKGYDPTYMTHTIADNDSSILVYCFDYGLKVVSNNTYKVINSNF